VPVQPIERQHGHLRLAGQGQLGLARRQPVVMVFEDAHWIDPTSRELLDLAVERLRSLPVLLIVTFRPQFRPDRFGSADRRRQGIAR
jgi:predicted ATPase